MRKPKLTLNKRLMFTLAGAAVLVSVFAFTGAQRSQRTCTGIEVFIDHQDGHFFVDRAEVVNLLTQGGLENLEGLDLGDISLKKLEKRLHSHSFVRDGQVHKTVEGQLVVRLSQQRPIARLVRPRGNDAYLSDQGTLLPESRSYTARVPLISGAWVEKALAQDTLALQLLPQVHGLMSRIHDSDFLKAQIAEVELDAQGRATLWQQVGKQPVDFGELKDIDEKFTKLMLVYQEILPTKGWNVYGRISLAFDDQIICE